MIYEGSNGKLYSYGFSGAYSIPVFGSNLSSVSFAVQNDLIKTEIASGKSENLTKSTWDQIARDQSGGGWLNAAVVAETIGFGLSESNSTFRVTNGAKGNFSPKLYRSGWTGGSRARINTYSVKGVGNVLGTTAGVITTGLAYNDIANGDATTITYVDAGVGTASLGATALGWAGYAVPGVGWAAGVYGIMRTSFELGKVYGPSKWYGTNDNKWFE